MCYHVLRVCSTGEVASTHTAGWSWSTQGINVIEELLTPRERFLVYQYDIAYQEIYRSPAISNQSLVYFLEDRFEFSKTWSAHSGRIPTYRKNSAKYLHRSSMQVYTGQDKLCSLGWPVNSKLARNMLTSPMPSIDPDRSDFLAGNSMHVANCSIVMLVALSCFGYHSCGPVCKWCFTSLSDADQNTWLAYLGRLFGWLLHFEICEVFCGQIKVTKLFSDKVVNCKLRFIPATVHMTSRCKHYTSWVAPKFLLLLSSLTHYLKPSQSCALAVLFGSPVCWDMLGGRLVMVEGTLLQNQWCLSFLGHRGHPKQQHGVAPPHPAIMPRPAPTTMYGKAVTVTGLAPAVKLGGVPTNPVPAASVSTAMVPWNPSPRLQQHQLQQHQLHRSSVSN